MPRERPEKPIYLNLYHGRKSIEADVSEDWGPESVWMELDFLTIDYNPELNGIRVLYGEEGENWIRYVGDMVYFNGVFYGCWSVHGELPDDLDEDELVVPEEKMFKVPKGKKLFSFEYYIVVDKDKGDIHEVTVFGDDEKSAVKALHKYIDENDFEADNRLDYHVKWKVVSKEKIKYRDR